MNTDVVSCGKHSTQVSSRDAWIWILKHEYATTTKRPIYNKLQLFGEVWHIYLIIVIMSKIMGTLFWD